MDLGFTITFLVVFVVSIAAGYLLRKKLSEKDLDNIRAEAERHLKDAQKESEHIKAEVESRLKDELYRSKQQAEREIREKMNELQRMERRLLQREENFGKKAEFLDKKEMDFLRKEREIARIEKWVKEKEQTYNELLEREKTELERISSMSADEAKKQLVELMEQEARHDSAKMIRKIEEEAKETANEKAQEIISLAIQRYAGEYVAERTVSVVNLPNDEMKGRIIGREGRNIRAIEAATGIDLIIDDTPEAVIISSMNPVRREIAKVALERLIADGRIHPGRIEEIVDKVEREIEAEMKKAGEQAVFDVGIHSIHPDIVRLIGKLKFRTSYAQNCYTHSLEVAFMCGIMAAELGLNEKQARRAGLLHDIGKAVDHEVEGSHAGIGAELLKKYGELDRIVSAVAAHHDGRPDSILGILIQAADALSAARPGARREMWETYIKRVEGLENIASSCSGVERAYAIQAGRELRVVVESKKVSDDEMVMIGRDITKKIEKELTYPGQIKVTVIRETRAVDYAK